MSAKVTTYECCIDELRDQETHPWYGWYEIYMHDLKNPSNPDIFEAAAGDFAEHLWGLHDMRNYPDGIDVLVRLKGGQEKTRVFRVKKVMVPDFTAVEVGAYSGSDVPMLPAWISVERLLPPEGRKVLVAITTGDGPEDWYMSVMYRYQHWCWRCDNAQIEDDAEPGDLDGCVTHWRELPGGPKP